jgi:mxaA protein
LSTAFAAGFLLARGRGWVPGFSVNPKPFARAAMQIANANSDNDALRALHRAFDAAAASRMLAADIPEFLQRHPHFQPLRADIELFFAASRAAFFSAGAAQTMRVPELRALARKLRRAERMA